MTKETKKYVTPNLSEIGVFIQNYAQKGYILAEGYPCQDGWQYAVVVAKEEDEEENTQKETVETKKAGRPKNLSKD